MAVSGVGEGARLFSMMADAGRELRHQRGDWRPAMRRILVDHARRRQTGKRGAGEAPIPIEDIEDILVSPVPDEQMLALDRALERLAALDDRQARVVELRFFGGLSIEETSVVLALSPTTIKREWATARAWLFREIHRGSSGATQVGT